MLMSKKYWCEQQCNKNSIYLAAQNEDSVDVGEDAMKTEVNVRTDQRKNWRQDAGARLELGNKIYTIQLHDIRNYCHMYVLNYCCHVLGY